MVVEQCTPDPFPLMWPIVAPFWADVDTNNGGTVYYREMTRHVDVKLAEYVEGIVRNHEITQPNFELIWLFVATWDQVAFYGYSGQPPMINNTFQALLVTDGTSSFAIFNYGDIQWTTGSASGGKLTGLGGIPAQVLNERSDSQGFVGTQSYFNENYQELEGVLRNSNYCIFKLHSKVCVCHYRYKILYFNSNHCQAD
ncbi:sushi, nidogen and EGF-like domain-containing protein 1 [Anneissia japonica]|uniref:sushi, nidogen and EGF-like domain-containing protein 1 n=1 Tax=Anneissia japonica TaxID=1529436 RepID=UPI0014255633|nr:sushi, nidogen and EGF-like domain-containing protein 1 [Anneissia japonica]